MNENKRKTKAFLITFIVILLLLIGGYYLFWNKKATPTIQNTSTTSGSSIGKFFSSLFTTQKPADINTIDNNTSSTLGTGLGPNTNNSTGTTTNTSTSPAGTGSLATNTNGGPTGGFTTTTGGFTVGDTTDGTSGFSSGESFSVTPGLIPIPTPTSSGSSTSINRTGDTGTLPPINDGGGTPVVTGTTGGTDDGTTVVTGTTGNSCDDTLVFTADEQAQLNDLLRQYYLLVPTLKTSADVTLVQNSEADNQSTIDTANAMTLSCQQQKASPSYTGPQAIKDNPYFQGGSAGPYLPDFSDFENLINIW